ncbi:MAG: MFS transporter [Gammaproteobacteria bacterium RIFCSPLOWO2_02_FULL_56_15]|nr:MAG: MFS transporter [Gammaproteobacteria bacterium RIFCSPLOWO2_02_FULL_56_15]
MSNEGFEHQNTKLIRVLACMMFFMFAMTTDAVGSIIPSLIDEFGLSLSAASAFHYVPMVAIALGGLVLGFLSDRYGRKLTIVLGLLLYGIGSLLFILGNTFSFFVVLLGISGIGVSVFKVGALALVGDITRSTREHTTFMNTVEGFFAIGAIVGPALVAVLLTAGISWKYLYVSASAICALLTVAALLVRYPSIQKTSEAQSSFSQTMVMMKNPYALGFSTLIMLYVAVEVAIYVWMPTWLEDYTSPTPWLATYALTIFFVLRAAGRFIGVWLLHLLSWDTVLAVMAAAILLCFTGSLVAGPSLAVWLLPLSGLFMSVVYPTLNSKGISCFPKAEHGAIAGLILFFTAFAAALGPLAMAVVSDVLGDIRYGFILATGFALLLCLGLLWNRIKAPAAARLVQYETAQALTTP